MKKILLALLFISALSFGEAKAKPSPVDDDNDEAVTTVSNDPLEPINRAIFKFNTVVDGMVMKPVAQIYRGVVPEWGRDRVSNIISNLLEPLTVVSSTLQGDDINAFNALWRFIFNSSFGLLGTFDVATTLGLPERHEDIGQTFATWGWKDSDYLVLPILGPSTFRDALGTGVEFFVADPVDAWWLEGDARVAHVVARGIDKRTELLPTTDHIDRTSIDRYTAYKSFYLQNRKHAIANGK